MDRSKSGLAFTIPLLIALVAGGCSSSSDSGGNLQKFSYATTSAKGDYAEWTLTGGALTAVWNAVAADGSIAYTHSFSATCGAADSFGVRMCTIGSSSCAAGTAACPGLLSGTFELMDVPGTALFVQIGSGAASELHVGLAKDSAACAADVSGDYSYIRTGLGLRENFGMYRSDANFISILHSDFGFDTPDANVSQSVAYRTGTEAEMLFDGGCVDGVRTRAAGGATIRSMMTAGGLFVLDFPSGEGGLVSFKVTNAATLADFANKTFGGIVFPDNADPENIMVTSGPVASGNVSVTASSSIGGPPETSSIQALATTATVTGPPYPDFTVAPAGYGASALAVDYATPSAIPGMFKLDNLSDAGRVILAAMKFNGKVVAVGMVYNYRTTSEINPATGTNFAADGLYNTGNFLIFER